ncbi:MAG TPA: hypothetical protein VHC19_27530 [Pirellulales bacterium]|nr:hypothetical protein [Pirellulales bacterium]
MNAWYFVAPVLLAVTATGCRANISQELLEQELRMQEDKIYEQQGQIEEYQAQLESCRRENRTLLKSTPIATSPRAESRRKGHSPSEGELSLPDVQVPGEAAPPYDGPPLISPPDPQVPEGERPRSEERFSPPNMQLPSTSATPGDHMQLPDYELPDDDEAPLDDRTAAGDVVTQITLNRKLTGGHNADGEPGDDGLMVVVEPLDAAGQLLEIPGPVSVVVLDPAQQGEAARVARWDFTAEEAAEHMKRTPMGDGLHFELRWPHSPPVNRELNLYVRYTTPDGKKLQVEKTIDIDLPGKVKADADPSWTKAEKPIPSVAEEEAPQEWNEAPRAKATAVRPAPDNASSGPALKSPDKALRSKTERTASPKWAPYR